MITESLACFTMFRKILQPTILLRLLIEFALLN